MSTDVDAVIIGAGVVGLACAAKLARKLSHVVIIEQAGAIGQGISSRNSEVIHSGIYYPQNSLKTQLCIDGRRQLYQYCQQHQIPFRQTGKLLIGSAQSAEQLESIYQRAINNDVPCQLIEQSTLTRDYSYLRGSDGLFCPESGIVDSHALMNTLLQEFEQCGGVLALKHQALTCTPQGEQWQLHVRSPDQSQQSIRSPIVINCAGLGAQTFAQNCEAYATAIPQLHYCKGHYFDYQGKHPFSHLVYPCPEPNQQGLGIHATLNLAGQLRFGPDTLYTDQENYDCPEHLKSQFAQAIKQYWPELDSQQLKPAYAGIRPKLSGAGETWQDFAIIDDNSHGLAGQIHCFGIESPGLTASLAIADHIISQLAASNRL